MKRADLLNHLKFAGYHADRARFTRLAIENRISMTAAGAAYAQGIQARKSGMGCGCTDRNTNH